MLFILMILLHDFINLTVDNYLLSAVFVCHNISVPPFYNILNLTEMKDIAKLAELSPFMQLKTGLLNAKKLDQIAKLATLYHATELSHEEINILLMLFYKQIDSVCEVRNYQIGIFMKEKLIF